MAKQGLSAAHELQVQQFLRFTCAKRTQHVKECVRLIDDLGSRKVASGEMYSSDEVQDILSELRNGLEKQVDEEVANAYHSSALMLQLALTQAQSYGTTISIDTAALENERLLDAMRVAEVTAVARPASDFSKKPGALSALDGARDGGGAAAGAAQERDQLRSEVEALRGRLQALQVSTTAAMRDKSDLARKLEEAEEQLAALRKDRDAVGAGSAAAAAVAAEAAAAREAAERRVAAAQEETRHALDVAEAARTQLAALQQQAGALQQQVRDKAGEARVLEAAAAEKLQASKQFKQLQALMNEKSQQVVALRRRLAKYEPEEVASADEVPQKK